MATYKCNACGATFTNPQRDGLLYFHVCRPLSPDELAIAAAAGTVRVDAATEQLLARAAAARGNDPAHPTDADLARAALAELDIKRPGHVDQNSVPRARPYERDEIVPRRSDGAGVVQVGA